MPVTRLLAGGSATVAGYGDAVLVGELNGVRSAVLRWSRLSRTPPMLAVDGRLGHERSLGAFGVRRCARNPHEHLAVASRERLERLGARRE